MFFVFEQLNFDEAQWAKVETLNQRHQQDLKKINDKLKQLKDQMFSNLHKSKVDARVIDSLATLIGNNEKERDKIVFYHFRGIQELCNEKQKETFKAIINDAIKKGNPSDQQPPPPREQGGPRPPHGQ